MIYCKNHDHQTPVAKWQPIDTAPKNGTEILAWRDDAGVMLVRYISPIEFLTESELEREIKHGLSEDDAETDDWFFADFVSGGRLEGSEEPTHWMPLPEPPT
ncbi:MAG: DUF551 domain-containing protein [Candidatus Thiodiazotropha sp. (ex Troendleina suluensis)]|nr:DUF551 domain-containing protein [Candidatus Thiodiazotropha sp. (ex Troendleina suluensis)]